MNPKNCFVAPIRLQFRLRTLFLSLLLIAVLMKAAITALEESEPAVDRCLVSEGRVVFLRDGAGTVKASITIESALCGGFCVKWSYVTRGQKSSQRLEGHECVLLFTQADRQQHQHRWYEFDIGPFSVAMTECADGYWWLHNSSERSIEYKSFEATWKKLPQR